MSTRKTPAAAVPETFEPGRFYAVDLERKTVWKGQTLLPALDLELRGDVAESVRADIAKATLLPEA